MFASLSLAATAGIVPPAAMVLPFAVLLLLIAIAPLAFKHHWERRYPQVSVALGLVSVAYYLVVEHDLSPIRHALAEYLSFIALIGSLFVVAGGIHIQVKGQATPARNCLFLLFGALLANVIGTTGASMVLIRPWIQTNKYRVTAYHIVFFIFIVSNVGGCLTPIGDPPLFLGFLRGVPFWWPLLHCWPAWLALLASLIAVFFVWDWIHFKRAPKPVRQKLKAVEDEWRFLGAHNLIFLAMIIGAIFLPWGVRELVLGFAALASWITTQKPIYEANRFHMGPIREIAWLFVGIFLTMQPALAILQAHAGQVGLTTPAHFYWASGVLSALLDNAPAYMALLATAFGKAGLDLDAPADMTLFLAQHGKMLLAISLGSVFFGAMTYIGNGPNFMVRSIAIAQRVETPGFIGYIVRYALPVLLPLCAAVAFLFLRS